MNPPTVSVIIPARDAAHLLPLALDSVEAQTYANIVDVAVASADSATADVAEGRATIVPNPSGRTATGLNLAIRATSGDVVVRCDAQSRLPPGYVERAVETLGRTGAANVGGKQVAVGVTAWEKAIAAAMSSPLGAGDARYRTGGEEGPVETVYLGVYRRTALEDVGGFDEQFTRTQDYELNHRIIAAGGVVWFDPELEVEYRPRGSLGGLAGQYFEYGRAKRRFARKHPGSLRWRQMAPPLLVLALTAAVLASFWVPWALVALVGYAAALLLAGALTTEPALRVAAALGTMHIAWGTGFLYPWRDA
jgi:glycosyltransferase involved in cell wall biosynthesis